jgi:hypothetical protein
VLVLGCRDQPPLPPPDPPPPPAPAAPTPAGGRFIASYGVASPLYRQLRQSLMASRLLDTLVTGLNDTIRVRENVVLAATECGEPNAYYRPEARRVSLCYELLDQLTRRYSRAEGSDLLIAGTFAFVLLHELGHAMVHLLDLPITGREEDAADQFATLLMLREGAVGDSLAFAVATMFAQQAESVAFEDLAFADEHGLDLQRVYNILCWIHGRAPERYPEVVREGWLTEGRAERCPAEFNRIRASWRRLLAPHLKVRSDSGPIPYP